MASIFLSHSHADKPFARRLASDLRLAGHFVWIDEAEIEIGDSLIEKIRGGLDQVDYVAAILSRTSIESKWVKRELDIASNRELKENRVVVLPIVIEDVQLPGFLEGKFYGDFTSDHRYRQGLDLLLRKLGQATAVPRPSEDELAGLREQLRSAREATAQHAAVARAHEQLGLRGKSERLRDAIEKANATNPQHAPINTTYAFEAGNMAVTLDYLLWAMGKAHMKGSHPLDILITMENKWDLVETMLQAYSDLLDAADV